MIQAENTSTSRHGRMALPLIMKGWLYHVQNASFTATNRLVLQQNYARFIFHTLHFPLFLCHPMLKRLQVTRQCLSTANRRRWWALCSQETCLFKKEGPAWKAVEEGRRRGEGFVKYGTLSAVLHHLRQATLQLEMRITWVMTLKSRETRITLTGRKNRQLVLKVSKDLRPTQQAGEEAAA